MESSAPLIRTPAPASHGLAATFEEAEIVTKSGVKVFQVEIAATPAETEKGLMYRKSVPEGTGMLFDFGGTRPAVFWMKNTLIPLDMLFIAADGKIADIHERAVLELNGGTVSRLKIRLGDVVHHPIFGNAAGG